MGDGMTTADANLACRQVESGNTENLLWLSNGEVSLVSDGQKTILVLYDSESFETETHQFRYESNAQFCIDQADRGVQN